MDLKAQTFTLEGVAASLLILLSVYAMFHSTVIIAPSWSEYANVQLKQLGYDILRVLDNPDGGNSSLQGAINNSTAGNHCCEPSQEFNSSFSALLNSINAFGRLEFVWVNENGEIEIRTLCGFDSTPTPNAVRVSRFVVVQNLNNLECFNITNQNKLVEVRLSLWRS